MSWSRLKLQMRSSGHIMELSVHVTSQLRWEVIIVPWGDWDWDGGWRGPPLVIHPVIELKSPSLLPGSSGCYSGAQRTQKLKSARISHGVVASPSSSSQGGRSRDRQVAGWRSFSEKKLQLGAASVMSIKAEEEKSANWSCSCPAHWVTGPQTMET